MSLPRQIIPGRFYLITRRCTQRQFLLRPDDQTNNAFTYCLAEAAQRHEIEVLLPSAMSNHHHTVIFDRHGHVNEFTEHFHKMSARSLNAVRGRRENFWSTEELSLVHLVDRDAVIDKVVYSATNPVKAGLVEQVHEWPGVNGLTQLLSSQPMCARRPRGFFSEHGRMPDAVTLELTVPPELGDREQFLREVRERVAAVEAEHARNRRAKGLRVLGRRAILAQRWTDSPSTCEPKRVLNPRFAAGSSDTRRKAIERYRTFLREYRDARKAYRTDTPKPFPFGTYWLRRFMGVPIAAAII